MARFADRSAQVVGQRRPGDIVADRDLAPIARECDQSVTHVDFAPAGALRSDFLFYRRDFFETRVTSESQTVDAPHACDATVGYFHAQTIAERIEAEQK